MSVILKPQDVLILLKLIALSPERPTFAVLAEALSMSPSEVHAGVKRAQKSRLYASATGEPVREHLIEFLVHGVKYAYPCELGAKTRGLPTAFGAPPLNEYVTTEDTLPPVWPYSGGTVAGMSMSPLYRSVPQAANRDARLYRLLVLVDGVRSGRVREQRIAGTLLEELLRGVSANK